jgi:hypothetical protein
MVTILDEVMKEWGLTISIPKTKIMLWGAPDNEVRPPLILGGEVVEIVNQFKYLGSIFTSEGGDGRDVEWRISKAWGCFHKMKKKVWRQKAFKSETKIKVYKMTVIPTLLYGMESWVLTEEEEHKLESTQMRMLRSIMRISLKDHKTNEEIRKEAGVEAIGDLIRVGRLKWFGKVMRMGEERWPKQVLCGHLANCNGRGRGRPPLRWTDKVQSDLKILGLEPKSCLPIVMDVAEWDKRIRSLKDKSKPQRESMEIPCGAPCLFVAKNKAGLSNHRKKCFHYQASIGKTVITQSFTCLCGQSCKGQGGLKSHQRWCRPYKKDKKKKEKAREEERKISQVSTMKTDHGREISGIGSSDRNTNKPLLVQWIETAANACGWWR